MDGSQVLASTDQLTVDYDRSLEEMIEAGRYEDVHHNITAEHFPIEKTGTVTVETVFLHPDRFISSDEVKAVLAGLGFRPATLAELLAVGELGDRRAEYLTALGSTFALPGGSHYCPSIQNHANGHDLDLEGGGQWRPEDWFLGCKESRS